jgi:hypothetical protein
MVVPCMMILANVMSIYLAMDGNAAASSSLTTGDVALQMLCCISLPAGAATVAVQL